jgi:hypothetical protein
MTNKHAKKQSAPLPLKPLTCCFSKFSMMTAVKRLSITMLTSSTNVKKKGMATQG